MLHKAEYFSGQFGNNVCVIIVGDSEIANLVEHLRLSTTNSIISITYQSNSSSNELKFGARDDKVNVIKQEFSQSPYFNYKPIIIGLGEHCSSAIVAAQQLNAVASLLLFPKVYEPALNDEAEIENRIIENYALNSHIINLKILIFDDARQEGSDGFSKLASKIRHFEFYSYDWPIKLPQDQLLEYFLPLIATSVNNINFDHPAIRSSSFRDAEIVNWQTAAEPAVNSEISFVGRSQERLLLRGNAQLSGVPAEKYGKQHTKIAFDQGANRVVYSVGPVKDDKLSFQRWEGKQVDYSVSSFSTFGGLGIDISGLSEGVHRVSVLVKNGKYSSEVVARSSLPEISSTLIHGRVVSYFQNSTNDLQFVRRPITELLVSEQGDETFTISIMNTKLHIVVNSVFFPHRGLRSNDKPVLLLIGHRTNRISGNVVSTRELTFDLDSSVHLGSFELFLLFEDSSSPKVYDLKRKLMVTDAKAKIAVVNTSLGRQLSQYLNNPSRSTNRITAQAIFAPHAEKSDGDKPLVVDLLDLAMKSVISNLDVDSAILTTEQTLILDSYRMMDQTSGLPFDDSLAEIQNLIHSWPREVILTIPQVPFECEANDGSRFFFDHELIKMINQTILDIEHKIFKKRDCLRFSPNLRGLRAARASSSTPNPFIFEEPYFSRFENFLLERLASFNGQFILSQ